MIIGFKCVLTYILLPTLITLTDIFVAKYAEKIFVIEVGQFFKLIYNHVCSIAKHFKMEKFYLLNKSQMFSKKIEPTKLYSQFFYKL